MCSWSVRAAIADASSSGDGMYPSDDVWCSEITAAMQPRVSAHSAMSIAAL